MLRSKKGSAMVEASVVYPMIIAAIVLFIAAAVYIYGMTAAVSDMSRSVRRVSGEKAGTVLYGDDIGSISRAFSLSCSEVMSDVKCKADFYDSFDHFYIFSVNEGQKICAESDSVQETAFIINKQAAENVYEAVVE